MPIDRHEPEDVFARVPELAGQTGPVLRRLDALLDDDVLYGTVGPSAPTSTGGIPGRCATGVTPRRSRSCGAS